MVDWEVLEESMEKALGAYDEEYVDEVLGAE
jgi:hypothetical protein